MHGAKPFAIEEQRGTYECAPYARGQTGCQLSGFTPAVTRRRINSLVDEGQLSLKVDSYAMIYVHLAGGAQS